MRMSQVTKQFGLMLVFRYASYYHNDTIFDSKYRAMHSLLTYSKQKSTEVSSDYKNKSDRVFMGRYATRQLALN